MSKVTIIIPAYNEAKTIGSVLRVAQSAEEVDEVLVVDDGSEDETARIASSLGARVLRLDPNQGKGAAMQAGAQAAKGEVLLFLDADLVGLTPQHIHDLLWPVVNGGAVMAVGVFGQGRMRTDLAQKLAPTLSGQRAIRKEVFLRIPNVDKTRYGVEVVMANYFRRAKLPITWVSLQGLSQITKEEKRGFWPGFFARVKMYRDILVCWRTGE